jgi:hypothetical protein
MGAMTNLLVKDDTVTTRTEFTLLPIADSPNAVWRANVADVPLDAQITAELSTTPLKSGDTKMTLKLEVPILETLGTAGTSAGYVAPQKVAYKMTSFCTMIVPKRSTSQNRSDALALMVGLLQGASSTTATGTLDQASAGQAFHDSTAPITEAFVKVIKPN